jgi:threonine/homoserine/homoserine lactone efflux protein
MAGLNDLSAAKALGLGAMLSGANPKNTILTLSAAASVAQAEVSTGVAIAVVAIYVVIASVTVAAPVGVCAH